MIFRLLFHAVAMLFLFLVMVLACLWIRSDSNYDRLEREFKDGMIAIGTSDHALVISDIKLGMNMPTSSNWSVESGSNSDSPLAMSFLMGLAQPEVSFAGFEYHVMPPGDPAGQQWINVQHIYLYRIPLYAMMAVAMLPCLVWLFWFRRYRRRAFRLRGGMCLACGYDLRQIESMSCPECGTPRPAGSK